MGFDKPSKIQEKALPLLLADPFVLSSCFFICYLVNIRPTNMIGQSQSGTGKTAAFVLTMLSRVDYDLQKPQVALRRFRTSFIFEIQFRCCRLFVLLRLENSLDRSCLSSRLWENIPTSKRNMRSRTTCQEMPQILPLKSSLALPERWWTWWDARYTFRSSFVFYQYWWLSLGSRCVSCQSFRSWWGW